MKSIKMVAVGAAAAALILGAGCSQRHDDSVRHDIQDTQGTGGSGGAPINDTAPSSATVPVSPPVNDSLRGMQDPDAIGHQDSVAKDSLSRKDSIDQQDVIKKDLPRKDSSAMHSSISTKKHSHLDDSMSSSSSQPPSDLSAKPPSDDLGVGGAGNTLPTPVEDTAPVTVPDNSAVNNLPSSTDTVGSTYTGVPSDTQSMSRSHYRRLNGSLDNETGSRTNLTGSNISTNTNPTEPRNAAKDQVPRR